MKRNCALAFTLAVAIGTLARADVIISSGYYDLSPAQSGGGPALPNPWYGSANTSFYGSASDISAATSSDPDISGLLFQNTGSANVALSALMLSDGLNVLSRASVASVTLAPGQFYIFAVGDGSDDGLSLQTISATLNGAAYSFADATTAQAPDGVLFGDSPQLGGGDETQPWTQDADLLHTANAAPEPASYLLLLAAVAPVLLATRRQAAERSRK